jgi:hypothetical protein
MAIKLNNSIYALISGTTTNVFPLILPSGTDLPAIVYERSFYIDTNKDAYTNQSEAIISVLTKDYNSGVDLADKINNILVSFQGTKAGINILYFKLSDCVEGYQDNMFIQKLTYEIKNR